MDKTERPEHIDCSGLFCFSNDQVVGRMKNSSDNCSGFMPSHSSCFYLRLESREEQDRFCYLFFVLWNFRARCLTLEGSVLTPCSHSDLPLSSVWRLATSN